MGGHRGGPRGVTTALARPPPAPLLIAMVLAVGVVWLPRLLAPGASLWRPPRGPEANTCTQAPSLRMWTGPVSHQEEPDPRARPPNVTGDMLAPRCDRWGACVRVSLALRDGVTGHAPTPAKLARLRAFADTMANALPLGGPLPSYCCGVAVCAGMLRPGACGCNVVGWA